MKYLLPGAMRRMPPEHGSDLSSVVGSTQRVDVDSAWVFAI